MKARASLERRLNSFDQTLEMILRQQRRQVDYRDAFSQDIAALKKN
jgi:hypothetical protein